jgi:hypothetical protein
MQATRTHQAITLLEVPQLSIIILHNHCKYLAAETTVVFAMAEQSQWGDEPPHQLPFNEEGEGQGG